MNPLAISISSFIAVFFMGLLSSLSPCNLPTILFVTSYVSGNKSPSKKRGFYLSISFATGMILIISLLGVFAGLTGATFSKNILFQYITAILLIVMSLWLLDIFDFSFHNPLSQPGVKKNSGHLGAFLLGLPFGLTASPCSLPITFSLLAYSANIGSVFWGGFLLLIYSIGKSIPIILVGTSIGLLNKLKVFYKYEKTIRFFCACLMILIALNIIWKA